MVSLQRSDGERSDSAESFDMPETDDEWLPSHQPPMTSAAATEAPESKRKRKAEVSFYVFGLYVARMRIFLAPSLSLSLPLLM